MDINDLKVKAWSIIGKRYGKARAINSQRLADALGVKNSKARNIVKRLIEEDNRTIVAITSGSGGYFVPTTEEELNHYLTNLANRIKSIAKRMRAVGKTGEKILADIGFGQLQLELKSE